MIMWFRHYKKRGFVTISVFLKRGMMFILPWKKGKHLCLNTLANKTQFVAWKWVCDLVLYHNEYLSLFHRLAVKHFNWQYRLFRGHVTQGNLTGNQLQNKKGHSHSNFRFVIIMWPHWPCSVHCRWLSPKLSVKVASCEKAFRVKL